MEKRGLREQLKAGVEELGKEAISTSHYIHDHPELGKKEYKSSSRLIQDLEDHGFSVEKGVGGMETAFKARLQGKGKGPRIAFLAEYDALGSLGHACGHNFIGAASTFAGISFQNIMKDLNGEILVIGTPAEETEGGKVILLEKGVFEDIDMAMMVHPSSETRLEPKTLASQVWEFEFRGRPAHAAAMPWKGINALDALIQMFVSIDQMRKQQRPTVRTPGIITYGGERPNIVPERAVGQFSCRGENFEEFKNVLKRVKKSAEGAATATGATVKARAIAPVYKDLKSNQRLVGLFEENWLSVGGKIEIETERGQGSLDVGNLSHEKPCIHPTISIAPKGVSNHTKEFAKCAKSSRADAQLIKAIKALALTALDVLLAPGILEDGKKELET